MKKLLLLTFALMTSSVFAQVCYVDMVDAQNRTIKTFTAYNNQCQDAIKDCRKSLRLEPNRGGVACIRSSGRIPAPIPAPVPQPLPPMPLPPRQNPAPQ